MDSKNVMMAANSNELTREFFGNILISQMNTIGSVGRLEVEVRNYYFT
jgi:hypothetical protein